jgi:hypothetical protein
VKFAIKKIASETNTFHISYMWKVKMEKMEEI